MINLKNLGYYLDSSIAVSFHIELSEIISSNNLFPSFFFDILNKYKAFLSLIRFNCSLSIFML